MASVTGGGGVVISASAPEIGKIRWWFVSHLGPLYSERVERACIEAGEMVKSYAQAIVHVRSGELKGSISSELRNKGVKSVVVVGSSRPYAAIEELRGLGRKWEEVTIAEAAAGEHSYLAKAMMIKREYIIKILADALGVA